MKKVKTLILRTAGTNCDMETEHAFKLAGADAERKHINALAGRSGALSKYDILAIPGGFSYGDDIASGKVLANELRHVLKSEIESFVKAGKLVIGICNGFQVLVKMGLLPDVDGTASTGKIEATLSLNNSGKFEDRWVYLKSSNCEGGRHASPTDSAYGSLCVWTRGLPNVIYLPVAHAEGKFIPKNRSILKKLKDNGQVVFSYSDKNSDPVDYPGNPNGSVDGISGVCDPTGRILGMMPHPERHVKMTQHPHWQRLKKNDKELATGLQIFKNGVNFIRNTK